MQDANHDERIHHPIMVNRVMLNSTHLNKVFGQPQTETLIEETDPTKAGLVSSKMKDDPELHMPVLDLDIPFENFALMRSARGNTHLYINHPMTWEQMMALCDGFEKAGLLDSKWRKHCEVSKMLRVRMPGVAKTAYTYTPKE